MASIDTYRFNSETEPTDEQLSELMKEVAEDVKAKYAAAHAAYFEQIRAMASL